MQVFLYLDGGVEEFLTKGGQVFLSKHTSVHVCRSFSYHSDFSPLFKCDPRAFHCQCQWSKAHCLLWVALHCFVRGSQLSLILSKRKWGERSLKWSEVVIVNVEPIFIVQRPLVSSVAMLLRLASPLTLELTKLTVTLSMQHPGGEESPQGTMTLQFLWPTLLLVQF